MKQSDPGNRRAMARHPLALDVILMISGQTPFPGKIRDMSLEGVFIETDASRLADHTDFYLALRLPVAGTTSQHRLPARRVRQTENGAGLVFTNAGISTIHALRKAIYPPPGRIPPRAPEVPTPVGKTR